MSAQKLAAAGFAGHLVSVVPAGAEISPNSTIKDAGKAPGKKGSSGWTGYNWRTVDRDPAVIDRDGANVGIRANYFPAVDIDVEHEVLANFVQRIAEEHLGPAPVRHRGSAKRLMVYRTEEPFARMAVTIGHNGEHYLVEILGEGRQFVVSGTHPSGEEYRFEGAPLHEVGADGIPLITREQADRFLAALAELLREKGLEVERIGEGKTAAEKAPPQEDLAAPSSEALYDLPLPPNPERYGWDEFIQHGYAYKAAGGDEAFGIWHAWAEQHPSFDASVCENEWPKLKPPFRVGWGWLQEQAAGVGGYVPATDEFDADPALAHLAAEEQEKQSGPIAIDFRGIKFSDEWAVAQILPALHLKLRYIPGEGNSGRWLLWRGHVWSQDQKLEHELIVRAELEQLAVHMGELAKAAPSKTEKKPFLDIAKRLQSSDGIGAAVRLLRAKLACTDVEFDVDPMLLNTPAGVVDLRTGAITPPSPAGMYARSTSVAPRKGPSPLWDKFLADLTGGDAEYQRFLQKMMGYALSGDMSAKVLGFAWGSNSDTGKSQFIDTLAGIFGNYADSVDVSSFIAGTKRGDSIPADLARLPGVRLVTATEPSAGHAWDERRIKAITGGDEISVRFLYGQWFTYTPQFKILIVGNHEPEIKTMDDAMLRRILILPMNRKVPIEKQIPALGRKMVREEGPQILAWLIEGFQAWAEEGLEPPQVVKNSTKAYSESQDLLGQWLEEQCEVGPEYEVSRYDLYTAWASWCRRRDYDHGSDKAFKQAMYPKVEMYDLQEKHVQTGEMRRRGYRGIRLRPRIEHGTAEEDFAA